MIWSLIIPRHSDESWDLYAKHYRFLQLRSSASFFLIICHASSLWYSAKLFLISKPWHSFYKLNACMKRAASFFMLSFHHKIKFSTPVQVWYFCNFYPHQDYMPPLNIKHHSITLTALWNFSKELSCNIWFFL